MFKVSFKESPKDPCKLVTKLGNQTTVLLRGTVDIPDFWKYIPNNISEWIAGQKHIEGYEDIAKNQLTIYSRGISKCHPDDHYDTVLGERLAEARAKCFIYRFFYDLTYKLSEYYGTILYGDSCPVVDNSKDGIIADVMKYEKLYRHELNHQKELIRRDKDE